MIRQIRIPYIRRHDFCCSPKVTYSTHARGTRIPQRSRRLIIGLMHRAEIHFLPTLATLHVPLGCNGCSTTRLIALLITKYRLNRNKNRKPNPNPKGPILLCDDQIAYRHALSVYGIASLDTHANGFLEYFIDSLSTSHQDHWYRVVAGQATRGELGRFE